MKKLLILLLSAVFALPVLAQQRYVLKGQVVDNNGEPLIGATVMVKGPSPKGTMADANGNFSVDVNAKDTLLVSMLSYEEKTIPVNGKNALKIVLAESATFLDEAVAIGYGEQSAKDVTGSITSVNMNELKTMATADLSQAMQGRVAGVVMTSADGQPGEDMQVLIRGANSVTQDNSPLYVIDGFAIEDFSMSSLNPEDIKSISVLKDASAGAIYGARGANGVIIIETKQGSGNVRIDYVGNVGVQTVSKYIDVMSPYEYVKYADEIVKLTDPAAHTPWLDNHDLEYYKTVEGYNWQKEISRPAVVHNHSLTVSGSTSKTKYSVSGGYAQQDGVIIGTSFKKANIRAKIDQQLFKKLVLKVNLNYNRSATTGVVANQAASETSSWKTFLMYRACSFSPMGYYTKEESEEDDVLTNLNPVSDVTNAYRNVLTNNFFGSATLEYSPIGDLKISEQFGYNFNDLDTKIFNNSKTYSGTVTKFNTNGPNGSYEDDKKSSWNNDLTVNYKHSFTKKTVLSATAAFSLSGSSRNRYGYKVINIPTDELGPSGLATGTPTGITSYMSNNTMMSFLGRVNFSYDARYLITVSARGDGSSKFAPGHKWGFFPSAALGWRIKNEKWMQGAKAISDFKIRASWGITGNNRIGDNTYFNTLKFADYYAHGDATPSPAMAVSTIANSNLSWEKTDQIDLGLDFGMFDNRLSLVLDLYRKTTKDLLLNAYIPYTTGISSATLNIGSVQNDGLEITLNAVPVKTRNFTWSFNYNMAFNRNKVLSLANNQDSFTSTVGFTGDFNSSPLYITEVGGPITAFYGLQWEGCYQYSDFHKDAADCWVLNDDVPDNGTTRSLIKPGDIKYADLNGDGTITLADMTVIGRALPIFTGGFGNDFRYKNLSLNIFLQFSYGNQVFNANRIALEGNYAGYSVNQYASYVDRWSEDNQDSANYRVGGYGPRGYYSSRTLEDASFLRIKNIQLAYDFPKKMLKKAHIYSLQLNLSAQNVWTFTKYTGADPEVSTKNSNLTPGFDYSAYPRNRVFSFGLKIGF